MSYPDNSAKSPSMPVIIPRRQSWGVKHDKSKFALQVSKNLVGFGCTLGLLGSKVGTCLNCNFLTLNNNKMADTKAKEKKPDYLGKIDVEQEPKRFKITIPDTMNKKVAADELVRMHNEENATRNYEFSFERRYFVDTLKVIKDALIDELGAIKPHPRHYYQTDYAYRINDDGSEETVTVFEGIFKVPAWENAEFILKAQGTLTVLLETDELKQKYEPALKLLVKRVRAKLIKFTQFEGSTVKVTMTRNPFSGEKWKFTPFLNKPSEKIFLNENERSVVNDYILPDLDSDEKRTYLACGGYGNGKTETAMKIGNEAAARGYLFIYLTDSSLFVRVMELAKVYPKIMIFVEDVDEIGSGERDGILNSMLNTLDGAETKNTNIKVLFTTNHENKLNPALRRPGRLDIILRFENPSAETLSKIMSSFLWECEGASKLDFDEAGKVLQSFKNVSGAVAAEVSKRALRLANLKGSIDQKMLLAAVNSIKTQVDLMNQKPETELDELDQALHTVGNRLQGYGHN